MISNSVEKLCFKSHVNFLVSLSIALAEIPITECAYRNVIVVRIMMKHAGDPGG